MKRPRHLAGMCIAALVLAGSLSVVAFADEPHQVGVEIWTDRGNDAVYQPGDVLQVRARTTTDAYLLIYEIDSEGYVRMLFPVRGQTGLVSAHETYDVPPSSNDQQLVVQNPTGVDYIVAIAAPQPIENLPWYLRPYDIQGDNVGYVNEPKEGEDDQGVTSDGKIVGDPFVAMERIRRRVLPNPNDDATFATAYTTYYVHEQVRYPRYICNDCHRPGQWAWWDGWDPYYSHCSVVDFRVNWSWGWGPTYWCGFVPYYVYVYRPDCPPRYRTGGSVWYSSWDGSNRWRSLWGGPLTRYKSPAPVSYVPPSQYRDWRGGATAPPPGFVVSGMRRGGVGPLPIGHNQPTDAVRSPRQPVYARQPVDRAPTVEGGTAGTVYQRGRGTAEHMPGRPSGGESPGREARDAPAQRYYQPPHQAPQREPAHNDSPRQERSSAPHQERAHDNGGARQAPARESHGGDRGQQRGGGGDRGQQRGGGGERGGGGGERNRRGG